MNRWQRATLAIVLGLAMVGMIQADDIVRYNNRTTKKEDEYRGKIEEETPGGIKIKVKDGKNLVLKQLAAGDIKSVVYESAGVDKLTFRAPFVKEERALGQTDPKKRAAMLEDTLKLYQKLADEFKGQPNPHRYIKFKIAEVAVLQARDDPARVDEAIKGLTEFKEKNNGSWQITHALKMLAKLQEDSGKVDDARKTYEELADLPDVPKELKQESEILVGKLLLRTDKWSDAEKRLDKLAQGMSAGDAQRPFVLAYLAESRIAQNKTDGVEKQLKDLISSSSDARLLAVAYNRLGDYYRKKAKPADAFWNYLRVDALYNEDAEEQAKALYYLSSLFDKEKKDPIRGKECTERLKGKRFEGTVYQKLVSK